MEPISGLHEFLKVTGNKGTGRLRTSLVMMGARESSVDWRVTEKSQIRFAFSHIVVFNVLTTIKKYSLLEQRN